MLRCHPHSAAVAVAFVALVLGPGPGSGAAQSGTAAEDGGLTIEHEAPGCVAAGQYARLSACFRPGPALARGRIYLRPVGTTEEDWFYVDMSGEAPCLQGILPRPEKSLDAIEYYVSGMDRET